VLLLAVAACDDDTPTNPSNLPTTPTVITELFTAPLQSGETIFYSFSVNTSGNVAVMLATTTTDAGIPLPRQIQMGVGFPSGTGCAVSSMITASAALTSQITMPLSPGVYCVNVTDPGTSKDPVNFNIRITHP
jgi:hypothetical protein